MHHLPLNFELIYLISNEGEETEAIELNDKKTKAKKDDEKEEKEEDTKMKKKEQSVLQAKLTKLAIQIGYAGKMNILQKKNYVHTCKNALHMCV